MWELDCKEDWVPKDWYFWTVVLEKTLESPLDCKEVQPVHPKGNQTWIFTGRTHTEAEAPILWSPDEKSLLIRKDSRCWERLRAGEADDRGWDGWMASSTQWTWVWTNSGRYWRTRKPGMLKSVGSQRVGHDLATKEQQQEVFRVHILSCWRTDNRFRLFCPFTSTCPEWLLAWRI